MARSSSTIRRLRKFAASIWTGLGALSAAVVMKSALLSNLLGCPAGPAADARRLVCLSPARFPQRWFRPVAGPVGERWPAPVRYRGRVFGGEEGLKGTFQGFGIHSVPRVGHAQLNPGAVRLDTVPGRDRYLPPSGMASRAFSTRFSRICWTCDGSILTAPRSSARDLLRVMFSPG